MKIEKAFSVWYNSTQFKRLDLTLGQKRMMQLAFEQGALHGFKEAGTKYNLVKKEGE